MQQDFSKQYQVCEEPAPFGIKIGTSVEHGLKELYNKKSRSFKQFLIAPIKLLSGLFSVKSK